MRRVTTYVCIYWESLPVCMMRVTTCVHNEESHGLHIYWESRPVCMVRRVTNCVHNEESHDLCTYILRVMACVHDEVYIESHGLCAWWGESRPVYIMRSHVMRIYWESWFVYMMMRVTTCALLRVFWRAQMKRAAVVRACHGGLETWREETSGEVREGDPSGWDHR
jgi:hypothetical protein